MTSLNTKPPPSPSSSTSPLVSPTVLFRNFSCSHLKQDDRTLPLVGGNKVYTAEMGPKNVIGGRSVYTSLGVSILLAASQKPPTNHTPINLYTDEFRGRGTSAVYTSAGWIQRNSIDFLPVLRQKSAYPPIRAVKNKVVRNGIGGYFRFPDLKQQPPHPPRDIGGNKIYTAAMGPNICYKSPNT